MNGLGLRSGFLCLLFCISASAQINTLDVPDTVEVGRRIVATCSCPTPEGGFLSLLWDVSDGLESYQAGDALCLWGQPGRHSVDVVVIPLKTITIQDQTFDVIAGEIIRLSAKFRIIDKDDDDEDEDDEDDEDEDDEDEDDEDDDDEDDDDEDDDDSDAPFVTPGLAVIIIYEQRDISGLPESQQYLLTRAQKWRRWVVNNCVKLQKADGQSSVAARVYDDDFTRAELANDPPVLVDAYEKIKAEATSSPWLAVSNGRSGFSGPLPETEDELIQILQRYK